MTWPPVMARLFGLFVRQRHRDDAMSDDKEAREKAHYMLAITAVDQTLKSKNEQLAERLELLLEKERQNVLRKHEFPR